MGLPNTVNQLFNGGSPYYIVNRSLRFRSSASAYLSRTPASASNRKTWTWNGWIKIGTYNNTNINLFSNYSGSSTGFSAIRLDFNSGACNLNVFDWTGSAYTWQLQTTQSFRDFSAWGMLTVSVDTTQATASNRVKIYWNGVQITAFSASTYPTQNSDTQTNSTQPARIGCTYNGTSNSEFYDGYLAEVNFIDGQALTPSSFGIYDSNGIWQPIKYTGTYGTNGFYLPFLNTTSTTTLVADASGNGNNWTPNNISLTAGTTYDSMIDSPTVSNASSNYAVLNPLKSAGTNGVNSGNLNFGTTADGAGNSGDNSGAFGSIAVDSGKWYFEATKLNTTTNCNPPGFASTNCIIGTDDPGLIASGKDYFGFSWASGGTVRLFIRQGGVSTNIATGLTQAQNDVFALAIDLTNNTIAGYKNGVQQGSTTSFTATTNLIAPCIFQTTTFNYAGFAFNFGQRPFSYTPPSGYNALNTANLPQPLISNGANYMAATLYTGNGGTQTINNGTNTTIGTSFQPDFVWIKNRAAAVNHQLQNSNAGWQYGLNSNNTNAEYTDANAITGATSSGWSMNNNYNSHNQSGVSYVGWNWKAGAGTTSTNTSGSITSTVSVSAQSGFSIATYTGTGANATVGHGLGVAPSFIIVRSRNNGGATNWAVWHTSFSSTEYIFLNSTAAKSSSGGAALWNSTLPSSTVFSIGTDTNTNYNTTNMLAYCFAAVRGYSAMGSYTGNGSSDGPFIFTGHRPRWLMIKRTDSAASWYVYDSSRNTYNTMNNWLAPNLSDAENTATTWEFDFLSNGFKVRNSGAFSNASGGTYIYAAFAENPFSIARAR